MTTLTSTTLDRKVRNWAYRNALTLTFLSILFPVYWVTTVIVHVIL